MNKLRDADILENPYRIYEEDRLQSDPIAFATIDRGMFPPEDLRKTFPIKGPSRVHEAIDGRRVRAVMTQALEEAAADGHTLLPFWRDRHNLRNYGHTYCPPPAHHFR